MSTVYGGHRRVENDHFHPEETQDPSEQRRRRGALEAIDYTAFACSHEVIARTLGRVTPAQFQGLALAAAQARAAWVGEALTLSAGGAAVDASGIARLTALRSAYDELLDAYEAARRMVERGHLAYEAPPA